MDVEWSFPVRVIYMGLVDIFSRWYNCTVSYDNYDCTTLLAELRFECCVSP